MDFNATIDLIIKDLDKAREIIDDLKSYPGVPLLQVELAKSKCKGASELIALLKTVSDNNISIVKEVPTQSQSQPEPQPHPHLQDSYIVADNFSHMSSRFNEQLSGLVSDDGITDFNKTKQVTNLSEAIGVNDRFLFIREIFNDNNEAYIQAITRLDKTGSMTDAKAVVMSYTGDNNENEAVKQLLDLVKRKLSTNE
jgi:hypothetical protein